MRAPAPRHELLSVGRVRLASVRLDTLAREGYLRRMEVLM